MITERRCHCKKCGKIIKTKGYWLNQNFIEPLHVLKICIHAIKTHGMKDNFKWLAIPQYIFKILVGVILQIIFTVLWIVTLPFWMVHEFCN